VNELADWYALGCPSRDEWEADESEKWQMFPGLGWNRPYPVKRAAAKLSGDAAVLARRATGAVGRA
jgi:hypothetical protein